MTDCLTPDCTQPVRALSVCQGCRNEIHHALHVWPRLYVQLSVELPRGGTALSDGLSRPTPDSRSPLREGFLALMQDATALTAAWTWELVDGWGCTPPAPGDSEGATLQRRCRWIADRLDAALQSADAHCLRGLDLVRLHDHARHRLGLTPLVHRLSAPCPACDVRSLVRNNGSDYVHCAVCNARWPAEHYSLLVRVLVDSA